MNPGVFESQINRSWNLLLDLGLGSERKTHPIYPTKAASLFRDAGYVETWNKCFSDGLYHFLLNDLSLVQFRVDSYNPLKASYVYYECPYLPAVSFEDFLEGLGVESGDEDESYYREEYDSAVVQQLKESYTPIRYDFDPICYVSGRHPASHIHFGHGNNIRVGTKMIMKPLSFILFILRQCYPDHWQQFWTRHEADLWAREVNINLDPINAKYYQDKDSWEMPLV